MASKYCPFPLKTVLEPACGGGRQLCELADRGYDVFGFDLNLSAVRYAASRLRRRNAGSLVTAADMTDFDFRRRFDVAHCLVNSFRHLLNEKDAVRHLSCVANALRPGGLYLLGLHLLPPDAAEDDCERWSVNHRGLRITTTVRVLSFSRRRRLEVVRFSLRVRSKDRDLRLRTDHTLRIYRADQMRQLLRRVPQFRLLDVYDFCYDPDEPLLLNDDLGDTVLVLQRI